MKKETEKTETLTLARTSTASCRENEWNRGHDTELKSATLPRIMRRKATRPFETWARVALELSATGKKWHFLQFQNASKFLHGRRNVATNSVFHYLSKTYSILIDFHFDFVLNSVSKKPSSLIWIKFDFDLHFAFCFTSNQLNFTFILIVFCFGDFCWS